MGSVYTKCLAMDLQGQKDTRVKDGAIDQNHFGVKLEEKEEENGSSSSGSNDFEVIIWRSQAGRIQESFDAITLGGKLLASIMVIDQRLLMLNR